MMAWWMCLWTRRGILIQPSRGVHVRACTMWRLGGCVPVGGWGIIAFFFFPPCSMTFGWQRAHGKPVLRGISDSCLHTHELDVHCLPSCFLSACTVYAMHECSHLSDAVYYKSHSRCRLKYLFAQYGKVQFDCIDLTLVFVWLSDNKRCYLL